MQCSKGNQRPAAIAAPMWYDNLGIISIACQNGGPEDGGLGDIKVDLWRLFCRHCQSTHCSVVAHYALVLRIDGKFLQFGAESISHLRRSKRDRYIGADIVIPETVWRGKSCNELRDYLARRVREALAMCVARLRKDKEAVDDASLFAEVDAAIREFRKIDYDHSGCYCPELTGASRSAQRQFVQQRDRGSRG